MPTVEDYDRKIDEIEKQLALVKERRKTQAAKEREQRRKWRAGVVTTVGELVLGELGCDWTEIDLECLRGWLAEHADEARDASVIGSRTPADAKLAHDQYKRSLKRPRTPRAAEGTVNDEPEPDDELGESSSSDDAMPEENSEDETPDW